MAETIASIVSLVVLAGGFALSILAFRGKSRNTDADSIVKLTEAIDNLTDRLNSALAENRRLQRAYRHANQIIDKLVDMIQERWGVYIDLDDLDLGDSSSWGGDPPPIDSPPNE